MKVKELIQQLRQVDEDAVVITEQMKPIRIVPCNTVIIVSDEEREEVWETVKAGCERIAHD